MEYADLRTFYMRLNDSDEENQGDIKVCRVCLILDVKMCDLMSYPMETYFEAVIGIPVISTMELPLYLCYECAALVKKFSLFKERCLRGQSALYSLLQNKEKFTEAEIKQIDRKQLQICSNLSITNPRVEEKLEHIEDSLEHTEEKLEYTEGVYDLHQIKEESIGPTDRNTNGLEVTIDVGYIKEEDDLDFHMPEYPAHSSDDEPLSVHKSTKEKKKGKKRGRKKKEDKEKDLEDTENVLQLREDEQVKDSEIEIQGVRKRGRPRKLKSELPRPKMFSRSMKNPDDINLEDYVNVITLTLEEQLAEVNHRKESSNYQNAAYQCQLCYKGFIDTNAWRHHQTKHDPSSGECECVVCKFRFPTRRALQKHVTNHEKKYACKSCTYVSKTQTQAKQHQRWHKGVTYSCEYCDEVSSKWTSYLSHVRMKHPSRHICSVCGYSFVSALGLTMHRTMMHKDVSLDSSSDQQGPYCKECDVKFNSTEAYNRHMVNSVNHAQTDDYSKSCRVCGATFSSPEELRIHHRKLHARHRPKNYGKKKAADNWPAKCPHCSEMIVNARDQWAHFRRSHPDIAYPIQKDYVCDICGKSFRGNAFLNYHKRTHSTVRAYKCSTCGKSFFNRINLNLHQRTHSESRPYPCDVCSKAFKCKGALDRHYRSHTGVKPYECEVCGKAFGQSNSRKLHVKTVHLKQPTPSRRQDKRKLDLKDTPVEHTFVY